MTLHEHAATQLRAVWKMVVNDENWRAEIDHSIDAVFKSLWAIAYTFPLVVLRAITAQRSAKGFDETANLPLIDASPVIFASVEAITFLLDWGLSIILLIMVAKVLNVGRNSADVIIGYNWIQLPMVASSLLPALALGIPGGAGVAMLIALPIFILQIAMLWGVIRRGFETEVAPTIAIIALLFLTGFIVSIPITSLAGLMIGTPA